MFYYEILNSPDKACNLAKQVGITCIFLFAAEKVSELSCVFCLNLGWKKNVHSCTFCLPKLRYVSFYIIIQDTVRPFSRLLVRTAGWVFCWSYVVMTNVGALRFSFSSIAISFSFSLEYLVSCDIYICWVQCLILHTLVWCAFAPCLVPVLIKEAVKTFLPVVVLLHRAFLIFIVTLIWWPIEIEELHDIWLVEKTDIFLMELGESCNYFLGVRNAWCVQRECLVHMWIYPWSTVLCRLLMRLSQSWTPLERSHTKIAPWSCSSWETTWPSWPPTSRYLDAVKLTLSERMIDTLYIWRYIIWNSWWQEDGAEEGKEATKGDAGEGQ